MRIVDGIVARIKRAERTGHPVEDIGMIAAKEDIDAIMRLAVVVGEAGSTDGAVSRRVEDTIERIEAGRMGGRISTGILADIAEQRGSADIPAIAIDQHVILRGLRRIGTVEDVDFAYGAAGNGVRRRIVRKSSPDQFERNMLGGIDGEDMIGRVGPGGQGADREIVVQRREIVAVGRLHSNGNGRAGRSVEDEIADSHRIGDGIIALNDDFVAGIVEAARG